MGDNASRTKAPNQTKGEATSPRQEGEVDLLVVDGSIEAVQLHEVAVLEEFRNLDSNQHDLKNERNSYSQDTQADDSGENRHSRATIWINNGQLSSGEGDQRQVGEVQEANENVEWAGRQQSADAIRVATSSSENDRQDDVDYNSSASQDQKGDEDLREETRRWSVGINQSSVDVGQIAEAGVLKSAIDK